MRYIQVFVCKRVLSFVEIGSYDEEELIKMGMHTGKNLSIELDALPCLRFFPHVENLIVRPGTIHKDTLNYLKDLPIRTLKLDYYSDCMDPYTIFFNFHNFSPKSA